MSQKSNTQRAAKKRTPYTTYTTAYGVELEVYPVASHNVGKIKPKTKKPARPMIEMPLKGGATQSRPMKQGDPGWEEFQEALAEWEAERDQLQTDIQLVLALRTFEYPSPITIPDHLIELAEQDMFELPDNPFSEKALYLREFVLGQNDEMELGWILQSITGVPEEFVQQQKDNFRRILLGEVDNAMGAGTQEDVSPNGVD